MTEYPRVLLQLDPDPHASSFDAIVGIDSGIDHLLQYDRVDSQNVVGLIHGAMFTRGPKQLKNTAVFLGGSNVEATESLGERIRETFFGPISVSVMLDGNGSNTTASAAVLCAARHLKLAGSQALVLGGTGPVGQRVTRLLVRQGAQVSLVSRSQERAAEACDKISSVAEIVGEGALAPISSSDPQAISTALQMCELLVSCGAAGVELCGEQELQQAEKLQVAIDLNAVPPAGIAGIQPTDKAAKRGERLDYGAIGVGGLKMKIHREAIATLFTRNDLFLDAEEIYRIGEELEAAKQV